MCTLNTDMHLSGLGLPSSSVPNPAPLLKGGSYSPLGLWCGSCYVVLPLVCPTVVALSTWRSPCGSRRLFVPVGGRPLLMPALKCRSAVDGSTCMKALEGGDNHYTIKEGSAIAVAAVNWQHRRMPRECTQATKGFADWMSALLRDCRSRHDRFSSRLEHFAQKPIPAMLSTFSNS